MLVVDTRLGDIYGIPSVVKKAENVYDTETNGGLMDTLMALYDDCRLKSKKIKNQRKKYQVDLVAYHIGKALDAMEENTDED